MTAVSIFIAAVTILHILGYIGLVNRNANWRLMKPIALAWLITVPAAGLCAALAFVLFNAVF